MNKTLGKTGCITNKHLDSSYRPEIDGLRALAVIAVIINHINKDILPSGYLGVDIFFVISGFVTTASLSRHSSENTGDFLLGFYVRRIKRLIPALVVFVFIAGISICLFDPSPKSSLNTGIASLFGVSNFSLINQSTDYFAASTELNVFTHTWSLGIETQFYILLPLLVCLTGVSNLASKKPGSFFWVLTALSAASLIAFISLHPTNQAASYFLPITRLWELGAGCLLFLSAKNENQLICELNKIPPIAIVMTMIAILWLPLKFAIQAKIVIVELTLILLICLRPGTLAYRLFSNHKIVYIGLISYSLYLWHWGVLSLSRWTIGLHWWSLPIQIGLILLLSILSYTYIEVPFRRFRWPLSRWQFIAYSVLISASVASLFISLLKIPDFSLYTGQRPSLIEKGAASLANTYYLQEVDSLWEGADCIISDNTQAQSGKQIAIEKCTLGTFSEAKRRVIVFGNSFSAAFVQGFDDLVAIDNYAVTITSAWDASPVKGVPNNGSRSEASRYYWDSIMPALIRQLQPNDIVFLVNDLAWLSPKEENPESLKNLEKLRIGLESFSDQLSAKGIYLSILHGNPFAREAKCKPATATRQWFQPFGGLCEIPSKAESLSRRQALDNLLMSLQRQSKIYIVDLFDTFCPKKQCTYNAANGDLLYRDEYSHPSVEGARLSAPIIRQILTSI